MSSDVVLCVAPNGARRTPKDHPALPVRPDDIAREARACLEAGARVLHLHVRDDEGRHSLDAGRYRAAMAALHEAVGDQMLVQVTTEAVGRYTPAEQMALLRELKPPAASVALQELAPDEASLDEAGRFFGWARGAGVALQYIVYDAAQAARLHALVGRGVIADEAPHALFVLGRYAAGQQSEPADLLPFLAAWPRTWPWSVCAFGSAEAAAMAAAIGLGGHVRVGFENNLCRPDGSPAARNADLVANAAAIARHAGRRVAGVDEARRIYRATA